MKYRVSPGVLARLKTPRSSPYRFTSPYHDCPEPQSENIILSLPSVGIPLAYRDAQRNREQTPLIYDYGSNPPLYPGWQAYFRNYQPPTLVVWGKNDHIFPAEGAHPYKRDLENIEFHLLDTGHFALEEDGERIANYMRRFLTANGFTVAEAR